MKSLRLAISAAASALALGIGTAAAEPVKIAFLTPKTGPLAFIGAMYDPTINFVQQPFNEAAGATGNKIDITVYDDSGTTQGAADRFKQAIADGARVFVGAGTSPLAAQNERPPQPRSWLAPLGSNKLQDGVASWRPWQLSFY